MNYYEHHIGDYDQATAHLSAVEDGIYGRMIRRYMATEKPLPSDLAAVQRLVRAFSREEKKAVQTILGEFFHLQQDGHRQHRCDEEIARFQAKSTKAKKSADIRWGKERALSDGNANAHANASAEHHASDMRTHSEGNALQSPDPNPQTPLIPFLSTALLPTSPEGAADRDGGETESDGIPPCPHEALIALYAHHFPTHAQPRLSLWRDGKNGKALRARWRWVMTARQESGDQAGERMATTREEGVVWFGKFFAYAAESDWLSGRSKREGGWACNLGWLVAAGNFEKVMSGQYENKEATHA